MANSWTASEIISVVEDYFEMLRLELDGLTYNKAEHNRSLREKLNDRTKSAVELKHQNISAILEGLGLRYINGYKPMQNYQAALLEQVQGYLISHPELGKRMIQPSRDATRPLSIVMGGFISMLAMCG